MAANPSSLQSPASLSVGPFLVVTIVLAVAGCWLGYRLGPRVGKRIEHMLDARPPARPASVDALLRVAESRATTGWDEALARIPTSNRDTADVRLARYLHTLKSSAVPPPESLGTRPQMAQAMAAWVRVSTDESLAKKRRHAFAKRFPNSWLTRAWQVSGKLGP